ncbi:MAG: PAS domain S-box protein [Candidatus Omnitrophica bacterium]|nr:PAS domain S-box protein [Candidatus Omnitrophota bacterium]
MHIKPKLLIAFFSIAIIPVLFVGRLSFVNFRDALLELAEEHVEAVASLKVDKIEIFFNGLKRDIAIAQDYYNIKTSLPVVTAFYDNRSSPEYIKAKKILDGQLKAWVNIREELVDFVLINPEGKVVYTANEAYAGHIGGLLPDPTGKAFPEGKKGIYISRIFKSQASGYDFGIFVTAPVYDFDNKFIGVIAFEINMAPIYKFIQDTTGLGNTGETFLVRKEDNHILYLNPLRHDPDAALKKTIVFGGQRGLPAQEAVLKKSGFGTTVDYRDKKVLAAWRYIPSLDWGLLTKMDFVEVLAPVFDLGFSVLIICLLIFVIAGIISFSLADSIATPIHLLHKGTEIIGSGNLDYKVGTDVKDEIGQLSRAFDQMTGKLKAQAEEAKAANQQLKASNQQLRATEQQLKASERQLRASNEQLRASEQQLRAGNQQLRKSEEQVRLLVESVKDYAIFMLDPQGNVMSWNSGAEKIIGYRPEEIIGKHFSCFYSKEDVQSGKPEHELEEAAAQGRCEDEGWRVRKDGNRFWANAIISAVYNSEGEILGFSKVTRDLTERKKIEVALYKSEERFSQVAATSGDWIWETDIQGRYTYSSLVVEKILGYKPEEVVGKYFYDFFHPDEREELKKGAFEVFAKKEAFKDFTNRNIKKDGQVVILETSGVPLIDADGKLIGFIGVDRDITKRKEAEEALRESEEKFRLIFDNAADGMLLANIETKKFEFGNKMILEMLGYNSEEIKNLSLSNIHPPEDLLRIVEGFEGQAKGEIKLVADALTKRKNGTVFYADITAYPIVLSGRKYLMGIFRDITESKETKDALLHAAEEWRTTFDSISDMVSIIDRDYKIIRVNKSFADRLKMRPQEVIGKTCYELFHGTKEPSAACPHKCTLETKMPQRSEYLEPHFDMYLEVTTSPIFNEKGDIIASVHIARDISHRKKLEKSQRLAELGKLVADMAHEVNNPLMIISGNAQLSLLDETLNEEVKNNLKIIHEETNRAKDIIQGLLKFSRPTKGERKETDINQSIASIAKLIEHQFSLTDVTIKKDLKPGLPAILIDEKQIQEVLMNLLNNAKEAMPGEGTIDISTSLEQDFLRIDIKDSGVGMDEETLSRVFEPFYTTKEKGTGLGLAVCLGIVKAHNGELKFESHPGKGTIATVLLPIRGG